MSKYDEQTEIAIPPDCPFFRRRPARKAVAAAVEVQPVSQHPTKPISITHHDATMVN